MKRIKEAECSWALRNTLTVYTYKVKHSNGKTYIVYAHDYMDLQTFLSSLEHFQGGLAKQEVKLFDRTTTKDIIEPVKNKKGFYKTKPFWYRGRVYEIRGEIEK